MRRLSLLLLCLCMGGALFCADLSAESISYDTGWDPPNFALTGDQPYFFLLRLPDWNMGKSNYSEARIDISYFDLSSPGLNLFAANPAADTGRASSYTIRLGTVPYAAGGESGTAQLNLLSLSQSTFNALFKGQDKLYLMASCEYAFDKSSLHLQADPDLNPVPVPPALLLFGSGLAGLFGMRRRHR